MIRSPLPLFISLGGLMRDEESDKPKRFLSEDDYRRCRPVYVVWEITLACDLKCHHCGSRAGKARPNELSTRECLDVVDQLARLGTREITLIGGEAYLRRDWIEIIRAVRGSGMDCTVQTGGRNLTEERLRPAVEAGLQAIGVSIDGLRELHDQIRGVAGSYDAGFAAIQTARSFGLPVSVNTQITKQVIGQLSELMERIIEAGVTNWQVQLTVAMGNAADNDHLLLQPYDLLEFMPLLADLYRNGARRGLLLQPGNNIGYFGPYESLWRGSGEDSVHWSGCTAGQNVIGLEADGTIKGCPSLPTTAYAGGNIRDISIETLWNHSEKLAFTRDPNADNLWGYCRSCYYADVCRAGCTWTAHVLFGRPGNNPFCHYRALQFAASGLRERLVKTSNAPGRPFDHGYFDLVVEPLHSPCAETNALPHENGRRVALQLVSQGAPS